MAIHRRVKLTSHLKDIRRWTEERKSDEWMATALGTSPSSVQSFRSRNGIYRAPDAPDVSNAEVFEGALEHDEGIGVWMDPEVADSAIWTNWRAVDDVRVRVTAERIVIVPG